MLQIKYINNDGKLKEKYKCKIFLLEEDGGEHFFP